MRRAGRSTTSGPGGRSDDRVRIESRVRSALEVLVPKLSREDIARRMQTLNGWTLDGDAITKRFTFAGFPEAVAFVGRLVPIAEAADHHPDVVINYKRVTLTYTTHDEGGLTEKDFDGAAAADRASA
jgi:4a-hydroxytetrahydrobiopterin dehydratase